MAGGGGTRLWPLSRVDRPKQLLRLLGNRSLFQMALDRLGPWLAADRILIAAPAELLPDLEAQAAEKPGVVFLAEPSPKGTASVIGLAALRLAKANPGSLMMCMTADHYIGNGERLRQLLLAACEVAETGALVTLGIPPTYADTGYGYIEHGASLGVYRGIEVNRALGFKEKPPLEAAEGYVRDGRHSWNSGMFVWKAARILEEIDRWLPELGAALGRIRPALGMDHEAAVLHEIWPTLATQTIDFGIMEHAENVAVVSATDLMWADIGGWDRLYDLRHRDGDGNSVEAQAALVVDSHGVLVLGGERTAGARPRLIALLGVEDLVVIDTADALLICPRDRAPEVRRLVERLREDGLDMYLAWES